MLCVPTSLDPSNVPPPAECFCSWTFRMCKFNSCFRAAQSENSSETLNCFLQQEGFAQGCPLGRIFAIFCLSFLLSQLFPKLNARAATRLHSGFLGDDGQGCRHCSSECMDDTTFAMALQDSFFFLTDFASLEKPCGMVLKPAQMDVLHHSWLAHPAMIQSSSQAAHSKSSQPCPPGFPPSPDLQLL